MSPYGLQLHPGFPQVSWVLQGCRAFNVKNIQNHESSTKKHSKRNQPILRTPGPLGSEEAALVVISSGMTETTEEPSWIPEPNEEELGGPLSVLTNKALGGVGVGQGFLHTLLRAAIVPLARFNGASVPWAGRGGSVRTSCSAWLGQAEAGSRDKCSSMSLWDGCPAGGGG